MGSNLSARPPSFGTEILAPRTGPHERNDVALRGSVWKLNVAMARKDSQPTAAAADHEFSIGVPMHHDTTDGLFPPGWKTRQRPGVCLQLEGTNEV